MSQTPTADRVELDKIYQYVNKAAITTGYLNDYGSVVVNKLRYNGLMTDSNFVPNMNVFRLTLNDLLSAKINPASPNLPSVETVNNTIEPLLYNTATPLIFNISQYDTIKEMAVIDNLLSFSSGSYYDVAGRSQSPYSTVRFFAACPISEDAISNGTLTLTYNSSLVYSNCGKQISTVAIDFGFGAGYQPLASGGTISKTYTDSTGYKAFSIKITCTDGSVYECVSAQYVTVPNVGARYAASNILPLAQFPTGTATINTGYATVVYSSLRQGTALANKLVKPLIIVEGLDENDLRKSPFFFTGFVNAGNKNMSGLLREWELLSTQAFYDFNGQLDDIAGYDFVYIDYYTLRSIQDNADMLIGLLNDINGKIETVGGVKQKSVILGIELGGLVARYALAKMTKTPGQTTNCRLLITHDAPHQGAYMPLGYQYLVEDFGGIRIGNGRFRDLITDFRAFETLKNSPIFNQLFLHKVNNGVVVNNNFLSPTNNDPSAYHSVVNLIGFNPSYQFVATSLGSQCGIQVLTPGEEMMKFDKEIFNINVYKYSEKVGSIKFKIGAIPVWIDLKVEVSLDAKYKLKLAVNALPNIGSSKEICKTQLDRTITLKTKFKVCPYSFCITVGTLNVASLTLNMYNYSRYSPVNIQPFESYAGGTNNMENTSFKITQFLEPMNIGNIPINGVYVDYTFFIIYKKTTYSYISRVSALDIKDPVPDDYTKLLAIPMSGLNRSSASKFLCHEGNNNGGITLFNVTSGRFTKRNATWMFNEMEGISSTDYCFSECGKPYINGPTSLCVGETQPLSLLGNTANTTSVTWIVGSTATINPTTGINTFITGVGNGRTFVYAQLSFTCPASQPDIFWFDAGLPPAIEFNIVSYPLPWGASEPTCFSDGSIIQLMAQKVYANDIVNQYEWGYRYGGVTTISTNNSPYFTFIPFGTGTYEVFVRHKNNCGASTQETVRVFEVVGDCPGGFGRMSEPNFNITANPNPTKNIIHLKITNINLGTSNGSKLNPNNSTKNNKVSIEVYKANERTLVKTFNFDNVLPEFNLPVADLKAGLYYLVYKDGVNNKALKIILE